MSFYHIRSRERAKYEVVIHYSVLVLPAYNRAKTGDLNFSECGERRRVRSSSGLYKAQE